MEDADNKLAHDSTLSESQPTTTFDEFASEYDAELQKGLSVSGEDKTYFARGRVGWAARRLQECGAKPRNVLDFGCGTGSSTPYFFDLLPIHQSTGVDASAKSLAIATKDFAGYNAKFQSLDAFKAVTQFDFAFCNGVFHHVPVGERAKVAGLIYRALRPGGWFAYWENNPWNPGTRIVMKRIPFDRDAVMISAPASRVMLTAAGFEIVRTDFLFIFPRPLAFCRPIEPWLARWPLGTQYQVLARKPLF